jgi:hypothetical protein
MYRSRLNFRAAYNPPSFLLLAFLFRKLVVSGNVLPHPPSAVLRIEPVQQAVAWRLDPVDMDLRLVSLMTLHGVILTLSMYVMPNASAAAKAGSIWFMVAV